MNMHGNAWVNPRPGTCILGRHGNKLRPLVADSDDSFR